MAPAEAEAVVDAYLVKKTRTDDDDEDEDDEGKHFLVPSDDEDEEEVVPLTEEEKRQVSDYIQSFRMSGGFGIPDIPPRLLGYVAAPISYLGASLSLMDDVNLAVKQKEMDLVPVEILSGGFVPFGSLDTFVTFKAKDSSGAVRTYETLLSPILRAGEITLEMFRVKPYTPVEYI